VASFGFYLLADPLGAHPQRVIDGGQIQVRVAGREPALTADFDAGIFKGS